MKKIFFTLSLITFSMQSMQNPDKKDALIKWALLRFISKADDEGVSHLIKNGAEHLVDQEVSNAANNAYEAYRKKPRIPHFFLLKEISITILKKYVMTKC